MDEISKMKKDLTEAAELILWSMDNGLEGISNKISHLVSIHDKAIEHDIEAAAVSKIEAVVKHIHHEIYDFESMSGFLENMKSKKRLVLYEVERQMQPKVKPSKEEETEIIKTLEAMYRESEKQRRSTNIPAKT